MTLFFSVLTEKNIVFFQKKTENFNFEMAFFEIFSNEFGNIKLPS